MALYDITRACGHDEEIQIYGTNSHGERERQAKYEATKLCADCYKEAMDRKRTEENAKAAQAAQDLGFPKLTGSDKQVAWAESIRAKLIKEAEDDKKLYEKQHPIIKKIYQEWLDGFRVIKDAKQWIDLKAISAGSIFKKFAEKHPEVIAAKKNMESKKAEAEAAKEAYISSALSFLGGVDWKTVGLAIGEIIVNGHRIELSTSGSKIFIDKIDGSRSIDYQGKSACWIESRPEVKAANAEINKAWSEKQNQGIKDFVPVEIIGDNNDPEYPEITVLGAFGRKITVVMWDDGWQIASLDGKSLSERSGKWHDNIINTVKEIRKTGKPAWVSDVEKTKTLPEVESVVKATLKV